MSAFTKKIAGKYKPLLHDKNFVLSVCFGFIFLVISLIVNYYAGNYATIAGNASNPVNDIILSNVPVVNMDEFFIFGPFVLWAFATLLFLYEPKRIPFIVKSAALFVLIRALFLPLTHIGQFPDHIIVSSKLLKDFTFGGDLFFSAHTGMPFLLALIFQDEKIFKWIFIATSVFFAVVVLLSHLHYTIDVVSAYFITYAIFHIAKDFFKKDWETFNGAMVKNA